MRPQDESARARSRAGRFVASVVLLGVGLAALSLLPSTPPPARAADPICTISAKLVNSCRPWIGAESGGYGGLSSTAFRARMLEHEARVGPSARHRARLHRGGCGAEQRHPHPRPAAEHHRPGQLAGLVQLAGGRRAQRHRQHPDRCHGQQHQVTGDQQDHAHRLPRARGQHLGRRLPELPGPEPQRHLGFDHRLRQHVAERAAPVRRPRGDQRRLGDELHRLRHRAVPDQGPVAGQRLRRLGDVGPVPEERVLDRDRQQLLQLPDQQQRRRARLPVQALGALRVRVHREQPDGRVRDVRRGTPQPSERRRTRS